MLLDLDGFGRPVPSFNISGDSTINTVGGGVLSTLILLCTIAYASVKLVKLSTGANPIINEVTVTDYYGEKDEVNLNKVGFRYAFTLEGYLDEE